MITVNEKELKALADKLLTTLGNMSPEEADTIVLNVANYMYTKVLKLKGEVKRKTHVTARIAGKCQDFSTYTFEGGEK